MNLNVGSGPHPAPGWVNMDIYPGWEGVDVVGSALAVPFNDETFDRVYMGHVLEHLTYTEGAPAALNEAWRVLRVGGELSVVGPAMDLAIATEQPQNILDAIEAHPWTPDSEDSPGAHHEWTATEANTLELVQSVFPSAQLVDLDGIEREFGWPNTECSKWQVAILAVKS